jgi:hypothetical protein
MRPHPGPASMRSLQRSLGGHWCSLSSPRTLRVAQRHEYLYMGGDPFLSTPRLWACLRMKATTFSPCCLIIPRISSRHGIRPLRRGSPKSTAATAHAFGSCCAPRLPRPEPDSIEANAQVEMGRAEVQPWEEGQRIYRQHLERIVLGPH